MNAAIHEMQQNAETIWCFDPTFEVVGVKSMDRLPIRVGDSVIFSKNDYETGLRNGSLGTVLRVLPVSDAKSPCCFCEFEGAEYQLKTPEVYALTHAYSITVHKSQESQFQ